MIRVEIRFKNATFMRALENNGYKSILQFSKASGIGYHTLIDYASLRNHVIDIKKRVRIAELLKLDIDVLFDQYDEVVEKNKKVPRKIIKEIPVEKMLSFESKEVKMLESDYSTNDIDDKIGLEKEVRDVLDTLEDREKEVIKLHFGIGISEPWALSDIAERFGLSLERMRQIKERSLRKLRHRSRSKNIQSYAIIAPSVKKTLREKTEFTSYGYSQKYARILEKEKRKQRREK